MEDIFEISHEFLDHSVEVVYNNLVLKEYFEWDGISDLRSFFLLNGVLFLDIEDDLGNNNTIILNPTKETFRFQTGLTERLIPLKTLRKIKEINDGRN